MGESIAAQRAAGLIWLVSDHLAFVADIYLSLGRCEEGLETISQALAFVEETGERHYEAEMYRLKGELILVNAERGMLNDERQKKATKRSSIHRSSFRVHRSAEAEACFQQALEISCRQEAKSLELRAAMSLSRLWQQQGKQQPAHQLLSEVYEWFTEGFDTVDLQEAKALLGELAEH